MKPDEPLDLVKSGDGSYKEPYEPMIIWRNVPACLFAMASFVFTMTAARMGSFHEAWDWWADLLSRGFGS